jgi:hypothetical protein
MDKVIAMARDRGRPAFALDAMAAKGEFLTKLGRLTEALELCDQAEAGDRDCAGSPDAVYGQVVLAQILAVIGQHKRLAVLLGDVLPAARRTEEPAILIPALTAAISCATAQQQEVLARSLTDELIAVLDPESDADTCQFLPELARILAPFGRSDMVDRMANAAPRGPAQFDHGALTARAVLAECSGNLTPAVDMYVEAADRWQRYGHPLEQAQALLGAARCLGRLRQPAQARLTEAREILTKLGAMPLLEETERLLLVST